MDNISSAPKNIIKLENNENTMKQEFYNNTLKRIISEISSKLAIEALKQSQFVSFRCYFNLFVSNAPFLYPLKTSENRKVF